MHSTRAIGFIRIFARVCRETFYIQIPPPSLFCSQSPLRDIGYLGRFILPSNLVWGLDMLGADYSTGGGNEEIYMLFRNLDYYQYAIHCNWLSVEERGNNCQFQGYISQAVIQFDNRECRICRHTKWPAPHSVSYL